MPPNAVSWDLYAPRIILACICYYRSLREISQDVKNPRDCEGGIFLNYFFGGKMRFIDTSVPIENKAM